MKITITAAALTLAIAATAQAQLPGRFTQPGTSRSLFGRKPPESTAKTDAPRDPNLLRAGDATPDPVPFDELKAPSIPAPVEPIDEFLLQKENGPFMVSAHTFTGPEAAKYAQILAMELRRDYHLPAYIWLAKVQPLRSNIYGVQPTAPPHARNNDTSPPERYRQNDEAAVLVGNCKTLDESRKLQSQVKSIRPKCIEAFPVIYQNRRGKGLNRAFLTTNPFAPSQNLFPGGPVQADGLPIKQGQAFDPFVAAAAFEKAKKPADPLLKRMNDGPNSIYKNPGKFTLQVAEFTGYSEILNSNLSSKRLEESLPSSRKLHEMSPLQTAADDAEKLAAHLNKCKNMNGLKAYAYHTRSSSFVTIGSFSSSKDPAYQKLLRDNQVAKISDEMLARKYSTLPLHSAADVTQVPRND